MMNLMVKALQYCECYDTRNIWRNFKHCEKAIAFLHEKYPNLERSFDFRRNLRVFFIAPLNTAKLKTVC